MRRLLKIFHNGIFTQNPVFVLMLAMCPTMAISTTLTNGLGMGISVTLVLVFTGLFISLLRKAIPGKIRIAGYIVIVAGFVTMVEMALKAWFPELRSSLGAFIPLIVVNCIILARAESFASKNGPLSSAADGLAMGLGFTLALCAMSVIRELLSGGSLLGYAVLPESFPRAAIFSLPPGGFLTLGFLIALIQFLTRKRKKEVPS